MNIRKRNFVLKMYTKLQYLSEKRRGIGKACCARRKYIYTPDHAGPLSRTVLVQVAGDICSGAVVGNIGIGIRLFLVVEEEVLSKKEKKDSLII